ncbi:MAG: 2-C-methyl-D-erythritol 2,4-cyclodiphosphate synthase [Oscillospiraceae bacterium]|nr:2-C-methyl-D-erythritol 2,4-cyclodiphosphate synthase [Oscillospiraceae bacterium]
MRIGHGYDVHKLVEGRDLILGGVKIDYEKGLLGHSDADVAVHALMDALLGAAALGDIGHLFPDSDDSFLGADSISLLKQVRLILEKHSYYTVNADITIIAQAPRMAPHIDKMRDNIASALCTDKGNISVKATTEEKLGFTGDGSGISAHAVVLIDNI